MIGSSGDRSASSRRGSKPSGSPSRLRSVRTRSNEGGALMGQQPALALQPPPSPLSEPSAPIIEERVDTDAALLHCRPRRSRGCGSVVAGLALPFAHSESADGDDDAGVGACSAHLVGERAGKLHGIARLEPNDAIGEPNFYAAGDHIEQFLAFML